MAHGSHASKVVAPQSTSYQGPFGRICGNLAPWVPMGKDCTPLSEPEVDKLFTDFAANHMKEGSAGADSKIPAGYTYFGQFVDHDITFDPASSLVRQNDPNSLLNFRTPRLDLDNLYGRGPHDQPYMFTLGDETAPDFEERKRKGALKFVIGRVRVKTTDKDNNPIEVDTGFEDLPRAANGRAIIGDMRNDENAIVSQMQLAFLKAHNELVERAFQAGHCDPFEEAKRVLRWLYQWIVWKDFVKRITTAFPQIHSAALDDVSTPGGGRKFELGLKHVYSWKNQPFMPVEFAVAAYRFGHTMVRNSYQTSLTRGFGNEAPLFDPDDRPNDLRGFEPVDQRNTIQWDWFLPMVSSDGPFPQSARKLDTLLSNALSSVGGERNNVLAKLNLKRGWAFGLPSGTAVATKLIGDPKQIVKLADGEPDSLWYYILKEAKELGENGESLGPLGATIVCAVFAGLLKGDPKSWVNQDPFWTPSKEPLLDGTVDIIAKDGSTSKGPLNADSPREWQLASIMRLAGVPIHGSEFPAPI